MTQNIIKEWSVEEQEWKDTDRIVADDLEWVEAQKKEIEKGAMTEYTIASKKYQENKSRWDEMGDED